MLFAFPRTRAWARWPLLADRARLDGGHLRGDRRAGRRCQLSRGIQPGNPVGDLIAQHQALADQLFYIMLGYAVIGVAAVFLVRGPRRTGNG